APAPGSRVGTDDITGNRSCEDLPLDCRAGRSLAPAFGARHRRRHLSTQHRSTQHPAPADMYSILFLSATAFVFCFVLTPMVTALSRRFGLLDHPRPGRKIHIAAVP